MAEIIGFFNEDSTGQIVVTFKDENGDLFVPSSVTYRIDDVYSGQPVVGETSVSPASVVTITISPGDNVIINDDRASELRRVTVKAAYNGGQIVDSVDYRVKNLKFVS
ncbi:MAG: hypothetical protein KatS3mg104_2967 [Phycisphaerae bacterium]|nr:MAG: hypothetical protein KatS3mg104_2967 [Phycisphaerae bacterium]